MSDLVTLAGEYWTMIRREPYVVGYWRAGDSAGSIDAQDSAAKYGLTGVYQTSQQLGPALIQEDDTAGSTILGSGNAGLAVGDTSVLELGADLSLEAWIAPYSAGQSALLVGKLNSEGTYANPYSLALSDGELEFSLGDGSTETTLVCSAPTPLVSQPSHVVATWFRSVMRLYLNGVNVAVQNLGDQTVTDGGESLYVGAAGVEDSFTGLMAEIAVYSGALSALRVGRHYTVGQQIYQRVYSGGLGPLAQSDLTA